MDLNPALLTAVAALITALGAAVGTPIYMLRKARMDRQPNATDIRAADAASNDLILKLLTKADEQVERDAKTIARQAETIRELQSSIDTQVDDGTRDVLTRALRRAEDDLEETTEAMLRAQEEAKRLRLAILRLRQLAEGGATFTGGDVIVWANNALDLTVPLADLLHLPADFDDTITTT
ncbi:MAG: hypothetical protein K0S70_2354 [Microbacterium sp.]|jgi:hypothetical protein|nr:hypothetical protein [Microbacterium sp.]